MAGGLQDQVFLGKHTKCTQIAPLRGAFPFIILSNARENTICPCTLALLAQRFPAGIGTFPGGVARTPIKTAKIMLWVHAGLYRARQASGIDTFLAGGDILASCPGMAMGATEVEIVKLCANHAPRYCLGGMWWVKAASTAPPKPALISAESWRSAWGGNTSVDTNCATCRCYQPQLYPLSTCGRRSFHKTSLWPRW